MLFPTGTYTVTRTATGARVNGHYTSGAQTQFPIAAGVQPVTGRLLEDLPEGMHAEETRVVFAAIELRGVTPGAPGNEPDQITIDGEQYRVVEVKKFAILAQRWRCYVERLKTP